MIPPLDWKFLLENFNQKCATPLDFQKFFVKNIQKIKNVLRPSSPPLRGRASPQGEALTKANSKRNVLRFVYVTAPHSSAVADTFPPRGSRKAAEHFCRKKWSLLNFFQARGRLWKRQIHNEIFCRDFCVRQGALVTADGSVQIVRNRGGRKLDTVLRKKNAKN